MQSERSRVLLLFVWIPAVGLLSCLDRSTADAAQTAAAQVADSRRIVVLHAFGHPYSPWSDMAASFLTELARKSPEPIEIHEISLDTARVRDPKEEKPFVDYILARLAGRKPDLIVPVGAPAAFFAQRFRVELFATAPMLILGADKRRISDSTLRINDAAVMLGLDLPAYLNNILRLRPETKEIAVVVGNSPVERYWTSELRQDFQPLADRVNITWFNDLTFNEMLMHVTRMPPQSAIFYFLLSEDAAGVTYAQDRALERLREVANVPIFGMGDYELGRGIVGGPLMQTQAIGRQAAEVALRILKGETPSSINTPSVLFGAPMYDWRELRRWGISESLLPPSSIVQFREPTVWQQYRWQMIAILFTLLLQAVMISWLLFERRGRQRAEVGLRQRLLEVIHLNRTATAGALSASVAHELNQPLGAIQSNAEAATLYLKSDPPNIERVELILDNIRRDDQRAADIISHLRDLLKKTDSSELQELDLNDVVVSTLQIVRPEALKRGVELDTHRGDNPLPVRAEQIHLQQVILNLAMNGLDAMEDCAPGNGRLSIQTTLADESMIEVSVADTGMGIPHQKLDQIFDAFFTTKRQGTGIGLSIARTIVETYGGKIWAENRPRGGAMLRFTLPLSKAVGA